MHSRTAIIGAAAMMAPSAGIAAASPEVVMTDDPRPTDRAIKKHPKSLGGFKPSRPHRGKDKSDSLKRLLRK